MKYKVATVLISTMLLGGCRVEEAAGGSATRTGEPDVSPQAVAVPQAPPFERAGPGEFGKPAPTNLAEITRMAEELTDARLFEVWLATRTNVSHVDRQRLTWLSSNPPQQKVGFTLEGRRRQIVLPVDVRITARMLPSQHEDKSE